MGPKRSWAKDKALALSAGRFAKKAALFNFHDNPAKINERFELYPALLRNC